MEIIPDKMIDLAEWLDARDELLKCPANVLEVAAKRVSGLPLVSRETKRLRHFRVKMGALRRLVPFHKERIQELCETHGWSRTELAKRSGVPYSAIFYYESGQTVLAKSDCLEKLARTLGAPVDYLAKSH